MGLESLFQLIWATSAGFLKIQFFLVRNLSIALNIWEQLGPEFPVKKAENTKEQREDHLYPCVSLNPVAN